MSTIAKARLRPFKKAATSAGLKWSAVKPCLPDWHEEALEQEAGLIELEGFVSRHLGVRLLQNGGFERSALPEARFKTVKGTAPDEVSTARGFVTAVARFVAHATAENWSGLSVDPAHLRAAALKLRNENVWVDFPTLLEISWNAGIPVVYLPQPPVTGKKMDGMVTCVAGRPVIILCKKQELAEWMVFILAHELGHIALGHLGSGDGDAIVDETVEEEKVNDAQEQEANRFANGILVNDGAQLKLKGTWPKAEKLAQAAILYGRSHKVSPGHAVLNAIRHTDPSLYPLAMSALKLINAELAEASTAVLCRDAARRHMDLERLKPDTLDYLEKLEVI